MANPVTGLSTLVPKLGIEAYASYNLGTIKDVGKFVMSAPATGTYEADPDAQAFATGGEDLIIRTTAPINSAADIVVTITGTDIADAPLTGTATIQAGVAESQAYNVSATGSAKFKTVTGVAATNGVAGDGFEIVTRLDHTADVAIGLFESANVDPGTEVKPIYDHYDLYCNKRIRGDRKLTLSGLYRSNILDLSKIHNRDTVIRLDFKDDGGNTITETWLVDKCRVGVKKNVTAGNDEIKENADGNFGRVFYFS